MSVTFIEPYRTVSFTGYRPDKIRNSDPDNRFIFPEIQSRLLSIVHNLAEDRNMTFLTGMAAGFDLMAARAVLLAQNTYPNLELIAVLPFPEQAERFTDYWKAEHRTVLREANQHICLSGKYHSGVYHRRNDFLIENSETLVCYYDGQAGGTRYTVDLARNNEMKIINLCRNEKVFREPALYHQQ